MPQLVMGASACALMLRLSLVNMQCASGLARDTYKFVAVSLTLASVCTALAQITQARFSFSALQHGLLRCCIEADGCAGLLSSVSMQVRTRYGCRCSCVAAKRCVTETQSNMPSKICYGCLLGIAGNPL